MTKLLPILFPAPRREESIEPSGPSQASVRDVRRAMPRAFRGQPFHTVTLSARRVRQCPCRALHLLHQWMRNEQWARAAHPPQKLLLPPPPPFIVRHQQRPTCVKQALSSPQSSRRCRRFEERVCTRDRRGAAHSAAQSTASNLH